MQHFKRPTALLLAILMVVLAVPTTILSVFASVNPVAKATLITAPIYTEYKTDPSPDGKGWESSPRGFYFEPIEPLNSVGEKIIRDYGPKFQAYCIDHGGKFRGEQLDQYVGYTPKDSTYFMSFSETQQKGILLCSAFGYPSNLWTDLVIDGAMQSGDCLEDAVAATQALLWEFNLNTRTGFGLNDITDDWAYAMVKDDAGALRAYTRILASAQKWLDEGHNWKSLLSEEGIVVWENGETAQVMLTAKVEIVDPFGSISIKKVDERTGEGLAGAYFTIYHATPGSENYGQEFEILGPTAKNENSDKDCVVRTGRSPDGTYRDTVPYGTYRIVETKVPDGYVATQKSWTVVVDEEHKHVELLATNRQLKKVQIIKSGDGELIANKQFAIYDDSTDKRLAVLTTDANGKSETVELPYAATYRWEEMSVGNYTSEAYVNGAWVGTGEDWTFTYDDIPDNATLQLRARNTKLPGWVTVKKTTSDGGNVSSFRFQILDPTSREVLAEGYTNADGYLITGSRVGVHNFGSNYYYLNQLNMGGAFEDWGIYNNIKCYSIYTANIKMRISEFLSEIKTLRNDPTGTYAVIMNKGDTYEVIGDSYTLNEAALCILGKKNGSEYIPLGFIVTTGLAGNGGGAENMNSSASFAEQLIAAWTARSGINVDYIDVNSFINYFKTETNSLSVGNRRAYAWDVSYDVNYDGKIDSADVQMFKNAAAAGRTFVENPIIALDEGTYILKEILTAEQAQKYAAPIEKTIVVKANETTEVVYTNRAIASSIRIVKESEDGVLAGFEFTVTGPNGFSFTGRTDESGEIFVEKDNNGNKVLAGEYTITEINVPGRYSVPQSQTVEVTGADATAGRTKTVTFVNNLKNMPLEIYKTSEDGIIAGFRFNIYGYNVKGEYVDIITEPTDASGKVISNIYPGKYYVSEIPTDDGRYVTPEKQEINPVILDNGSYSGNTVSFNNVLKKFTVELYKEPTNSRMGNGDATLFGAEYGLFKDGVLVETQVTKNVGGRAYLKFGTYVCSDEVSYTVRETKAPEGYYIDPTVYTVDSSPKSHDTEVNTITITSKDQRIYGKITIYKLKGTDDDNVPEAGAVFRVYLKSAGSYANASESVKDIITTDKAVSEEENPMGYFGGIATTKELPYGTYIVEQIIGDERFELAAPFEVVIDADHTSETYTVLNKTTVKPVTVTKQDITGTKNLPGAELKLVDEDGNEYTGTTDENGQYVFTVWPAKSYTLTELVAPEGYVLTTEAVTFTLDIYGEVIEGSTAIKNEPNRVVVQKVDDEGNPLANATFECINADSGAVFGTADTNEDGIAVFECLPYGNYEIREVKCPAGYKLSDEVFEFTITSDWTNQPEGEYDFVCVNEDSEVTISKIDITSQAGIPGATVEIYDANGNVYASGVTDDKGEFTFYNIVPGEYTFKEVKAPSSYELNTTVFSFTVTEKGEIVGETVITDKPNKYVVKKVDANGEVLAGAMFEMINDETGEVFATATSGEDGLAIFESIPYGNYTIKETTPAPGYVISGEVIKVEVTSEWINVGEGEFNSEYLNSPTSITFEKKDASTGEYVPGAEITVYDADGNAYAKGTTDETGRYTIHNIKPGEYTWKETYAPAGYVLNETVFSFTITENGEVIGDNVLSNTPVEVIISKTDVTNGEAVPGAAVIVEDNHGNEIFNGLTDENGQIVLEYLAPGKYTFRETKAPVGYKLNKSVFEFEVTEKGEVIGTTEFTNEPTEIIITKYEGTVGSFGSSSSTSSSIGETLPDYEGTFGSFGSSSSTNVSGSLSESFSGITNIGIGTSKPLPVPSDAKRLANATIIIVNEDGEVVHEGVTDENGEIKVQYLAPGKYTFYEVNAPEGYALNPIEFTFSIDENGEVSGTLSIVNELMRFRVYKVNELNQPMKDVEFTIYDEDGDALMTVKTDEEGYATFEGLKHGKYTIREVKTLDGYLLANDSIKIEVNGKWLNDAEDSTVKVINEPIPVPGDGTNMLVWGLVAMCSIVSLLFVFKTKKKSGAF